MIQRGPRNDRNANSPAHEDVHQQWTEDCEEQARVDNMNYKIRGAHQGNNDTFLKTKTVTRAISPTGISHYEKTLTIDSSASMHMMSVSDLSHEEKQTVRKSKESCMIVEANGSITSTEGDPFYVKDFDMFITVQNFQDSPSVLSLRKGFEEQRYFYKYTEE